MRLLLPLLVMSGLSAAEALPAPVPAPATVTATEGTGPSAGARTTESTLAADYAWALARKAAEQQAMARRSAARTATRLADTSRRADSEMTPVLPGGLAALVGQDEVALLLELQRRRRSSAGSASANLVANELTTFLTSRAYLPIAAHTSTESTPVFHPEDDPFPGPRPPVATASPDRPEQLPTR